MRKRVISFLVLAALGATVALAYAKPRPLIESVSGVTCVDDAVCTDDLARVDEATRLYEDAFSFVGTSIAPLTKKPLVVFCSTDACYQSYGHTDATARSVGGFCIVISPRGWKPYYIRHEMIHRLQWQELGLFGMIGRPEWFVEGMAYALSGDPREQLREPFQGFRSKFSAWYSTVGREALWTRAREL